MSKQTSWRVEFWVFRFTSLRLEARVRSRQEVLRHRGSLQPRRSLSCDVIQQSDVWQLSSFPWSRDCGVWWSPQQVLGAQVGRVTDGGGNVVCESHSVCLLHKCCFSYTVQDRHSHCFECACINLLYYADSTSRPITFLCYLLMLVSYSLTRNTLKWHFCTPHSAINK